MNQPTDTREAAIEQATEPMMRFTEEKAMVVCGCRSVGECGHNNFAWMEALDQCVDAFAKEMKSKLRRKAVEGRSGWDDPDWTPEQISQALIAHLHKGDPIDVANFAMFAWNKFARIDAGAASVDRVQIVREAFDHAKQFKHWTATEYGSLCEAMDIVLEAMEKGK